MIEFFRSISILNELIEFMHLGSLAGAFYFVLFFSICIWLYRRQESIKKKQAEQDIALALMKQKKDLNKVAYNKQEERNNILFNHTLKESRMAKLHRWKR